MAPPVHGNPSNRKPDSPHYIPDADLRNTVNDTLNALTYLAMQANRGDQGAEAAYHRTAADLLEMRPAIDKQSERRQRANAKHLRNLAFDIDRGAVASTMT